MSGIITGIMSGGLNYSKVLNNSNYLSNSAKNLSVISGGRHFEGNATVPVPINEVVEFNTKDGQWMVNGAMNFSRNYHAIDVIPLEDVFPHCIFDWKDVIVILYNI